MGRKSREKKERKKGGVIVKAPRSSERHYDPGRKALQRMDINAADAACKNARHIIRARCPVCEWPIMLHCDECAIQITGCGCTMGEKAREAQDAERRERMRKAGLMIPDIDKTLFIAEE